MLKYITIACWIVAVAIAEQQATVTIQGEGVKGTVKFTQTDKGVHVEGEISGLTPGYHGFHVHQFGDLSGGCASTGGHFNPYNKNHGAPEDTVRHVGDLGNIKAAANGVATINITDSIISLNGECDIIGRAIVVHAGQDDFGKGGFDDSLTTGHAGGRVGCGIIGRLSNDGAMTSPSSLSVLAMCLVNFFVGH